jgi:threonine aldolase
MEMIVASNLGHTHGYGDDEWTQRACAALKEVFECDLEAFFVPTGTAANTLALSCMVQPWQSILCHSQAHLLIDESTAPEFFTGGARPIGVSGRAGKLTPEHLTNFLASAGTDAPHNARPGALSVSQASELGLVYSSDELRALSSLAHEHNLLVHMDGARFGNAVAALGSAPAELTWKAGIDVLSLGATKNGCLAAEAVVFFQQDLAASFSYRRKRAGHLLSKGRFFGAQFVGWLRARHWLDLATSANAHAARLAEQLASIPGVKLAWPTEANEVFAVLPTAMAHELRTAGATFYDWYADSLPVELRLGRDEVFVRLVASFATRDGDISDFCTAARACSASK